MAAESGAQPGVRRVGIIGGSGLYRLTGMQDVREVKIDTPFGAPSDSFVIGRYADVELVFVPRHGRGHRVNPSEVNYRANIFAMKTLGVEWIIAVSAVGSLKEEIVPGHVVVVDQFIDRTKGRKDTFFEGGIVGHVAFGDPLCQVLRDYLVDACRSAGVTVHVGGTYVNMEGPAFSTVAESQLHRSWGASVIGMTLLAEAKLAREAEISYAAICMATDYDCWHPDHAHVTQDSVVQMLAKNARSAHDIVRNCVPLIAAHRGPAPQANALAGAIATNQDFIPAERLQQLRPLLHKYYPIPPPETPLVSVLLFTVVAVTISFLADTLGSS